MIEDSPSYNINSLISQMGSIANLWAGITVVLFVEIIELFYRVCCRRRQNKIQKIKVAPVSPWKNELGITKKNMANEKARKHKSFSERGYNMGPPPEVLTTMA